MISDSCFAGDLIYSTRSLPAVVDEQYFREAYSRVSRQVLTSGATETVPDVSVFAEQLKSTLRRNRRAVLDTLMLYNEVRLGVKSTVPLLDALAGTAHQEGASFLLFLKEEALRLATTDSTEAAARPREEAPPARTAGLDGALPGGSAGVTPTAPGAGYLSAGIGLWWLVPVGAARIVQHWGMPASFQQLDYNLQLRRGELAFGLLTGVIHTTAKQATSPPFEIAAYPIAGNLRISTRSTARVRLAGEVAIGAAIARITFCRRGGGGPDRGQGVSGPEPRGGPAPVRPLAPQRTGEVRVDLLRQWRSHGGLPGARRRL